jgi:hypothetical protein
MPMTCEGVRETVRAEAEGNLGAAAHGITLKQALVHPQPIVIINRLVRQGIVTDEEEMVWLVGKERSDGGYMIVMREDGQMFGLASHGIPSDPHPILVGWYGDLVSTFLGM